MLRTQFYAGRRVLSRPKSHFAVEGPSSKDVAARFQASLRIRSFHHAPPLSSALLKRSPTFVPLSSSRFLSSSNLQENPGKARDLDTPPLQAGANGGKAKAKVELRPGPVKPTSTAKSSSSSTPSSGPATSEASAHADVSSSASNLKTQSTAPSPSAASEQPEASKTAAPLDADEAAKVGVVETAKRDVEDATRHGILAPPPEGAGVVRRFMHQAWQLFKFYFAGLKLIVSNGKEVKAIQDRLRNNGNPLTWREHRFIRTYHSDRNKLVPFVLTILILEEIIPLIVIYAPGLLPSTCILPSQRDRILTKRHEKQRQAFTFARLADIFKDVSPSSARLSTLDDESVNVLCSTVGVSSTGIFGMQRRRLSSHLQRIADEDAILLAESKGARLSSGQLLDTLWERGIIPDALSLSQQRQRLGQWLDRTMTTSESGSPEHSAVEVRARVLLEMHKSSSSSSS